MTRGGSEGRLLTREGARFGCYQYGGGSGCDQHVATAMTTSVEGWCSLTLREVLHMATTAAGSIGGQRDAFSVGMMTIAAKGKLFLSFWRLAYTHPRIHSTTLFSSFENDASPHPPLCRNI